MALVAAAGCAGGPDDEERLSTALTATAGSATYRVTQSNGLRISADALGLDVDTEIDPDAPALVGEIGPDRAHLVIDLSAAMGFGEELGPLTMEVWVDSARLVIDTRGLAPMLDGAPGATLGPMAPGLAYIDLATLGAEAPAVVAALAGSGPADLGSLATNLPAVLRDLRRVDGPPAGFTGTSTYAELLAALGSDLQQMARSGAAGVALNLGVDVDGLAEVYADYYRRTSTDVTVELDDRDHVRSITTKTDLSDIFDFVYDRSDDIGLPLTDDEREEIDDLFADTVWRIESRITFEPSADLVVPAPPAGGEDRTASWRAFLLGAGIVTG
jgi:hypothetical protein